MLLPTALIKLWIHQVLSFIVNQEISLIRNIKFLIGNFTGVPILNSIPGWQSEIVNQSGMQANPSKY